MTRRDRERIVFHGAIVLFVGFLCGIPALADELGGAPLHAWQTAGVFLIVTGIWLLATAALLPSLALEPRETSGLVWALLGTGYGFMIALLVQAITGVRGVTPRGPAANWIAFAGNTVGLLGAALGILLTMLGARAALKGARVE